MDTHVDMNGVAGVTSNNVPWEILRAAGYSPRLLEHEHGPTPHADRWMEDVFDPRIRVVFDRFCAGAWNHVEVLVLSRTSEQEHKLYLYLREVARSHPAAGLPKLYLYNLLHTRTPEAHSYGLERTRQMVRDFGASEEGLREAIAESNRARNWVRRIAQERRAGRIEGSAALELIRGFYTGDRGVFSQRTGEHLEFLNPPAGENRPRILIEGAPLPDARLHRAIEAAGGYVLAENDWMGSRAAGDTNVRDDMDPVTAIFEKYFFDEVSPRVHPAEVRDAWLGREIERGGVDGVIFHLPLDDDVFGWDYPRHLAYLSSRGIPSLLVRNCTEPLGTFIGSLGRK